MRSSPEVPDNVKNDAYLLREVNFERRVPDLESLMFYVCHLMTQ